MKGWKTVAFSIALGLITVFSSPELQQFVAENLPWVGPGLATAVVVLRAFTASPIFKKE